MNRPPSALPKTRRRSSPASAPAFSNSVPALSSAVAIASLRSSKVGARPALCNSAITSNSVARRLRTSWRNPVRRPPSTTSVWPVIESSACKVKAGDVVTKVTQKAVELMGPLGYSRKLLLEKWMRDAKINDLFEGTGQINRLIIARRLLGYTSRQLK